MLDPILGSGKQHRPSTLLLVVLVAVLLTWPTLLKAQRTVTAPWVVYTQEDGLASNNVFTVVVSESEVWFGTDSGLSRFDGAWTSWKADPDLQSGVRSIALAETELNGEEIAPAQLWAGTETGAVLAWNGQSWNVVTHLGSAVWALYYTDGQLWIGTETGLYFWNGRETGLVEGLAGVRVNAIGSHEDSIWVGTSQGLWLWQHNVWRVFPLEDGLPGREVTALWVDPAGPVWVAADGNIAWRDPAVQNGVWQQIQTANLHIRERVRITSLTGDRSGVVWGSTAGSGYFRIIERDELIPQSINLAEKTTWIQSVAVDVAGSLWLGTVSGVFRSDQEMWGREILDPAASPINEIHAMLMDAENHLWIATRGEGIRLKDLDLDTEIVFNIQNGLPSPHITDLALDDDGRIWAGTWKGISSLDPGTDQWAQPIPAEKMPSEFVTTILAQQQHLWVGTDKGLALYDIATGALFTVEALERHNVQDLTLDSLDRLWVATESGGIFLADLDGEWIQFLPDPTTDQAILGRNVVALAPDPKVSGAMWAGVHQQGLNYFDGRVWHDLTATARLPSKVFYDFYIDPIDASLWICSEGGVARFDGRSWETLVIKSVLPATSIFSIIHTHDGTYWFGGRDGLTFYRPDRDRSPPWIEIVGVSGASGRISTTAWEVATDEEVIVSYMAGDIYTPRLDLIVLYRLTSLGQIGEWKVLDRPFLRLSGFTQEGEYQVELQARDFAFNYSDVSSVALQVVPLTALIRLPFLGSIRPIHLIFLLVSGTTALIGISSMSYELVQKRRRTREAIARSFNPFISGEPVRRDDMFFGRRYLLQRLVDTLHNNSVMIHGERRIGKTTLLYQLATHLRELDDPEYWFLPLYVDLEGTEEDGFFHSLMEEIIHTIFILPALTPEIKTVLQDLLYNRFANQEYTDREFSRDLRNIIRPLQAYGEEHHPGKHLRLILLLDEMDVLNEYGRLIQQRLRRIFMRDFSATLGAVIAGIRLSKEWDRIDSPWYNLFNEIQLEPFTREQAIELLTEPVQDFYDYEPSALDFIIEKSNGRPYRLQQFGLEVVGRMLAAGRRTITLEDAHYAHHHIQLIGG